MVTDSISSGLTSLNLLPKSEYPVVEDPAPPEVDVLSIATPSITIKALLLPVSEPSPLNTILVDAPTEPEAVDSLTPAVLPLKPSRAFLVGVDNKSSDFTVWLA